MALSTKKDKQIADTVCCNMLLYFEDEFMEDTICMIECVHHHHGHEDAQNMARKVYDWWAANYQEYESAGDPYDIADKLKIVLGEYKNTTDDAFEAMCIDVAFTIFSYY